MKVILKRGISLVGAVIVALATLIAPAASADPPWPIEQSMDTPGITTTLSGDVVVSECVQGSHSRDYWSQTFDGSGQQIASVDNTGQSSVDACNGSLVGRDNRRFTLERTSANPWPGVIVGYEGDQQTWSYVPSTSCSSGVYAVQAKGVAGNGTTAYLLMSNGCGSDPMFGGMELVGLSMATGAVVFQTQLPSVPTYGAIRPYLNGYVYYVSGQGFKYLNASGVAESSKDYSTGDFINGWAVGASGELAVLYSSSGPGCTQYLMLRNGHDTMYRSLTPSSGCQSQTIHVTPTGSAVVVGYANYQYMQDFSLIDETPALPVKKVPAVTTTTTYMQVDVAGNLLATDDTGVTVYNAQGSSLQRLTFSDYFPVLVSGAKTAFGQGVMYVVAQKQPRGPYNPNGYPTYLAKVSVAGVGVDYPRGTFLGDTTEPMEPFIDYVAKGDSYSAGEGVPSFESGTDIPDVNECHRSPKAYPRVLAQEEGFNLTHFAACSGATAARLTSPWDGSKNLDELAQWDHLSADTDLVTMTIGGNDMPFRSFAEECIHPLVLVSCNGQAKTDALAGIVNNVTPNVQNALTALSGKLNTLGSDAVVLVIGYPYLVPETVTPNVPSDCSWLDEGENDTIREVTDAINTAIKDEVEQIYNNFYFVSATESTSPFIGHELCMEEANPNPRYFNDYEGPSEPISYIAHPNEAGQRAYADLVDNWLTLHPEVLN